MVRWLALAIILLVPSGALPQVAGPAAPDMTQIENGMKLYRADGVDCEYCHDWRGVGKEHEAEFGDVKQAGGPALITSLMSREQMIEIISCGKIIGQRDRVMPQYRGDAWTAALPCYGKTLANTPVEERPVHGKRQMNPREVEAVVDYIRAVYQGKRMSVEWCLKYFPTSQRICDTLL
ncbi:MAG: hypothetical protein FJX64_09300 [Alphaproteobacteria bacterium]|nr:hypothetical protein [Alphaproteobacteria bacterium]